MARQRDGRCRHAHTAATGTRRIWPTRRHPSTGCRPYNVDQSCSVIVLKRSTSTRYARIDNPLFFADQTSMLFGDTRGPWVK